MSYILEALKKADRERNLGDVPDLESAHWGVRKVSYPARWPWLVAVLLLFNAGLIYYLLERDESVVAVHTGVVNNPPADLPAGTRQIVKEPLQQLKKPAQEKPRDRRPRVKYPPSAVATVQQSQRADANPTMKQRVVGPTAAAPGSDSGTKLPEWDELPLSFRSGFTLPHIDVHVYAEEPARRFVLIDLKKYREGETLDSGAVLEKIAPGSIQLFYQGTRFRVDR